MHTSPKKSMQNKTSNSNLPSIITPLLPPPPKNDSLPYVLSTPDPRQPLLPSAVSSLIYLDYIKSQLIWQWVLRQSCETPPPARVGREGWLGWHLQTKRKIEKRTVRRNGLLLKRSIYAMISSCTSGGATALNANIWFSRSWKCAHSNQASLWRHSYAERLSQC